MQTFSYVGVDSGGKSVTGKLVAADEASLEGRLRAMGLWLVEAHAEKATGKSVAGRARTSGAGSRREIINFCVLMSFQLKVGITIVNALQVAAEDCEAPGFRRALHNIREEVEAGSTLAEAMEHQGGFSKQFTSLVRAGEKSGTLPDSFMELRRYLEWQEQVIADVRQATIYPAIVFFVVCAFVMILFTFVIPRFVGLLAVAKVQLPLPTLIVFGISGFATATWWVWLILLVVVPLTVMVAKRSSKDFAIFYDKVKFKLPLFGSLNHMLAISRFAQNLAVLYRSGINIVEAMRLTQHLVGSAWVATVVEDLATRIQQGETISEAIRKHPVFPGLLLRMVVMGEKTGNLDKALENVSEYYNLVVPRKIKKIFSIAEPALILFLVVIVGFVALAIFMPILGLLSAIKG
jgi:type II secretory pathway component PulF